MKIGQNNLLLISHLVRLFIRRISTPFRCIAKDSVLAPVPKQGDKMLLSCCLFELKEQQQQQQQQQQHTHAQ